MFECACYGTIKQNFINGAKKEVRQEHIYTKDGRHLYIRCLINKDKTQNELLFCDQPDRNKQKTCVITEFQRSKMLNDYDPRDLANALGYVHVATTTIDVWICEKNGYQIELTLSKKTEWYLVKIFVETEDVAYGEALIEKACMDFEGLIKLSKPDFFYSNNW